MYDDICTKRILVCTMILYYDTKYLGLFGSILSMCKEFNNYTFTVNKFYIIANYVSSSLKSSLFQVIYDKMVKCKLYVCVKYVYVDSVWL